ncbi:Uncharacterized membrane protein [Pseudobutyrivibrio sp. C4]|uniref:SHOCT domain-containing protein n=1 Tax=Pseudobutyrivibrio sp. C4 TaxID=1520803 RepID=UPI0008D77BB7|nr:SHOCT domain-containing protein [Pseudobutyrivibrio sp. C4]SES66293.1 Uncharacterized membrane protein [Pseudobutyrivibrio sp. C4]
MNNYTAAEEIKKYKDLLDQGIITEEEFEQKKDDLLNPTPITTNSTASMDAHTTGIVAYLTWIGFLIALLLGDREGAKFHINQALVINLFFLACAIPVIGRIWWIFMIILWVLGLVAACNDEEKPVPILGEIRILN